MSTIIEMNAIQSLWIHQFFALGFFGIVLIFVSVSLMTNDWYILPDIILASTKWSFYALPSLLLTMTLLCTK